MKLQFETHEWDIPWEYHLRFAGRRAGHNPFIYHIISVNLLEFEVSSIIEVGTADGALTMYLGLWGARLGVPVLTFDISPTLSDPVRPVFEKLGVEFVGDDVFRHKDLIREFTKGEPTYLICDGGDKPREYKEIGGIVPVASVISVHDWGHEINELTGMPVFEVHPEMWGAHDVRFATVQKIGEG